MILNILINLLNICLNFLFIYPSRELTLFGHECSVWGAGWGVGGAAFASGLSTAVVFLLFVLVLFRKRSPIRISLKERFSFERTCLSAVWRLVCL